MVTYQYHVLILGRGSFASTTKRKKPSSKLLPSNLELLKNKYGIELGPNFEVPRFLNATVKVKGGKSNGKATFIVINKQMPKQNLL